MKRRVVFRQFDVTRALKAAKAAGVEVRVIIRTDGELVIEPFTANGDSLQALEEARARRGREIVL